MCEMCCSGVKCSAVTSKALSPAGGLGERDKGTDGKTFNDPLAHL